MDSGSQDDLKLDLFTPAPSRLWSDLFNVSANRSGVLNQRGCQTVERSVYLLSFTELSQTAHSFMLVGGHCARVVEVELLERGPSITRANARRGFF